MLRPTLLLSVAVAVALAGSSPADAYPLNDGVGSVVWGFEGHGSAEGGGLEHSFTGELHVFPYAVYLTAHADGDADPIEAWTGAEIFHGSPANGGDRITNSVYNHEGGITSAPAEFTYSGNTGLAVNLSDLDGIAFNDAPLLPGGYYPPPYAPDIDLFEQHELTFYQEICNDYEVLQSYCVQGGGIYHWVPRYTITIDAFLDPIPAPEPGAVVLAASALALAAAFARVRRAPH